jgi:hypothetical protein
VGGSGRGTHWVALGFRAGFRGGLGCNLFRLGLDLHRGWVVF